MQMSSAGNDRRIARLAGFTLIEVLVVLMILGLTMAVVVPAVSKGFGNSLDENARTVQLALRKARSAAVLQQRSMAVLVDLNAKSVRQEYSKRTSDISERLSLRVSGAASEQSGSVAGIRFFPDGSSTGGRVMLAVDGESVSVNVDWLTGRVSIVQGAN